MCQCLCPQRHAIAGLAIHDPEETDENCGKMLRAAVAAMLLGKGELIHAPVEKMEPQCGICGAPERLWIYEVKWSKEYATWDEAQIAIKEMEERQHKTKALLDMLGISYDAQKARRKAHEN